MPLAALVPGRPALLHFGLFAVLLAIESVCPRHVVPGGRWPHVRRHLGLNALNLVLYAMFSGLALTLDELRLRQPFGLFMWLQLPSLVQLGLGLLLLDLCDYSFHRLEHAVGFLWRFHRVHHSDPGLDVTTSLRTHPVSLSLSWIYMQAGLWLLGAPQALLVLYFGIGAFVSHWQHANVELLAWRHERIVAFLVNTPRVHRRHHSRRPGDADGNFSDVLSLWDRLFGTYRGPAQSDVRFGVEGLDGPEQQDLLALLRSPEYQNIKSA